MRLKWTLFSKCAQVGDGPAPPAQKLSISERLAHISTPFCTVIQHGAASLNISGTDLSQGAWGSVLSDFAQEAWPPGLPEPTTGDLELPGCPVLTQ